MRTKVQKTRCVKRQLTKCKGVCRTYDDVQYAGADYINELDGVKSFECNVLLKGLAEGDYTTDFVLTMEDGEIKVFECVLALYKKKNKLHKADNLYLAIKHPDQLAPFAYKSMTIAVYNGLLEMLQKQHPSNTYSQIIEYAIADFLVLPMTFYTDCISPLYTIVGSKNNTMQKATTSAVDAMKLSHKSLTLIDGCCAIGSLFFGLKSYPWKSVILNDLNPLRTNFLNVLKKEPLKLIKQILETDLSFIEQPDTKNPKLSAYKKAINDYAGKRAKYHKVDCNIDIAYQMFIIQCIDKATVTKQPTCTEAGEKTYTCSCGHQYTDVISKTGHTAGDWEVKENATCKKEGTEVRKCTSCGKEMETRAIAKTGHTSSDWIVTKEATETAEGTKVKKCTVWESSIAHCLRGIYLQIKFKSQQICLCWY